MRWLDGQPWDFSRWGDNEPNGGDTENCIELVKWADWVRIVFALSYLFVFVFVFEFVDLLSGRWGRD